MTVPSRAPARIALANLLAASVPTAQAVYPYQKTDFKGASPVVLVVGAGTNRPRFTLRGVRSTMYFAVQTYVVHSDEASGWTEAMAEDALDALEAEICDVLASNQRNAYWQALNYEMRTVVSRIPIAGVTYLYEVIPVEMEVL